MSTGSIKLNRIKTKKKFIAGNKDVALPSDTAIQKISVLLEKQSQSIVREQKYAPVKNVLALLGRGAVLSAALLIPKSAPALISLIKESPDWESWKRYNMSYLQRTLRRLEKQKHVEILYENGQEIIRLTKLGQRKILKYSLDSLTIDTPKHWDGKWRLVLYDVPVKEKQLGDLIRQALRNMNFYAIQDSVYIFPYPCFDQIEFLRAYYQLGDKVQYMLIDRIERDSAFKTHFGLS